ncbi:MAG: minor capsid protein [Treponema sp.]|nr:minor capsid protein [Treponema sp.]
MTKKAIAPHLKKVLQDYLNTVKNAKKSDLEKPFIPQDNTDFILAIERCLISSYLLGMIHAEEENPDRKINAGDENIPPVPFAEAIDFLKARVPMTKKEWEKLEPKLRFRAFTVAKLGTAVEIETAKQILVSALEKGESYSQTWETLNDIFGKGELGFKPGYWENVFRTNTQTAYMAGKLQQYEKTPGIVAYQLMIIEDVRTSKICRNLITKTGRGLVLSVDDDFWKTKGFPPYHFQCRSSVRAIFKSQIKAENIKIDEPKHLDRFKVGDGFGGNPISKGSFWLLTENMKEKALEFGLTADIIKMAHNLGLANYDFELASNFGKPQQLQNTKYKVKALKKAKPKQKEILVSKILEENGHSIVMLPEVGLQGISNPDALIDYDIVADYKVPDGSSFNAVRGAVYDADSQMVTHMVYYPRIHDYSLQECLKEIKKRLRSTEYLKEVWVIWDDLKITV